MCRGAGQGGVLVAGRRGGFRARAGWVRGAFGVRFGEGQAGGGGAGGSPPPDPPRQEARGASRHPRRPFPLGTAPAVTGGGAGWAMSPAPEAGRAGPVQGPCRARAGPVGPTAEGPPPGGRPLPDVWSFRTASGARITPRWQPRRCRRKVRQSRSRRRPRPRRRVAGSTCRRPEARPLRGSGRR